MSTSLTRTRRILWGVAGILAAVATGIYVYATFLRPVPPATGIGTGEYSLVTAQGEPFTHDTIVGSPSMVFFGFTHCPDVCPTTLSEMTGWYEVLGNEARDLKAYFISVDPERDTPEVMGDYVSWTGRVTGVTGTPEEIAKATRSWAVYAEKVPLSNGGYNVDHTASVFLMNRRGEFEGTISYNENTDISLGKLRKLLALR